MFFLFLWIHVWIGQLDSEVCEVRERAESCLSATSWLAYPSLKLKEKELSPEGKRRIRRLCGRLEKQVREPSRWVYVRYLLLWPGEVGEVGGSGEVDEELERVGRSWGLIQENEDTYSTWPSECFFEEPDCYRQARNGLLRSLRLRLRRQSDKNIYGKPEARSRQIGVG